jgi:hypothetical protein
VARDADVRADLPTWIRRIITLFWILRRDVDAGQHNHGSDTDD